MYFVKRDFVYSYLNSIKVLPDNLKRLCNFKKMSYSQICKNDFMFASVLHDKLIVSPSLWNHIIDMENFSCWAFL